MAVPDSKPHSRPPIEIVREALQHVRYDEHDGYTPRAVEEAVRSLEEQLRSREDALREVYELIALGEPDNALHGLDAYLIREGIYRGEMAPNPASELDDEPVNTDDLAHPEGATARWDTA